MNLLRMLLYFEALNCAAYMHELLDSVCLLFKEDRKVSDEKSAFLIKSQNCDPIYFDL
jgi:hypothetical protein